jgi:DNA-binding XRE family transcriptional regulator
MSEKQVFGEVLAALRKRKGLTQQDVADQIGVSKSAVYGFEKGRSFPVPDKLVKLARYFKVTVDYLLTGEEPVCSAPSPQNGASGETASNDSVVSEPPVQKIEHGKAITHEGRTVTPFRIKPGQPEQLPGTDLVQQVAKNTREIELMQHSLETVLAELRQLSTK